MRKSEKAATYGSGGELLPETELARTLIRGSEL